MKTLQSIGSFEVTSGKLVVSDPCYDHSIIAGVLNVKNGQWNAEVSIDDGRPMVLKIEHVTSPRTGYFEKTPLEVDVDSGQAGFFESSAYRDDSVIREEHYGDGERIHDETDPFYAVCCSHTLEALGAGTFEFGAVSSSGYGDGTYECLVAKNDDGEIVSAQINFDTSPYDDEEEEEDWDEEGWDEE